MGRVTQFYDCNVLKGDDLVKENCWVRDGKFISGEDCDFVADVIINCHGSIIAPGLIDTKVNGALGVHFGSTNTTKEDVEKVRRFLPATGVTLFCPSIETHAADQYPDLLGKFTTSAATSAEGAGILGVHLDGPFITQIGGHKESLVQSFGEKPADTIKKVYGENIDNVRIVTLAPDLPGATEAIHQFKRLGVSVSLGHSKASITAADAAVKAGASMVTHLFNAMPDFHHRDPGLVGLATTNDDVYFSIISDRFHVHPAALLMAYRMSPKNLMIVSDAQFPLGLGPGEFECNGVKVVNEEIDGLSVCYLGSDKSDSLKRGTLYGSVCPLHRAVKNFANITRCTVGQALACASTHPAKALGIYPQKGCIAPGSDADFIILRPQTLDLAATFIAGQKVADNELVADTALLPCTLTVPVCYRRRKV